MKSFPRAVLGVALLALLAFLGGRFLPGLLSDAPSDSAPPKSAPSSAQPGPRVNPAASPPPPAERPTMADELNSPKTDIRDDLRIVSEIVDTFRTNFPRDGNPVGNNAEITASLTGKNKLRLALIPPDHAAINPNGELCDRWGTPFFFHAESAKKMEIRSAGPDKKMWNDDDVVFAP